MVIVMLLAHYFPLFSVLHDYWLRLKLPFAVKRRHFACTGVCIDFDGSTSTTRVLTSASLVRTSGDENKILDNLEVCSTRLVIIYSLLVHQDTG